MKFLCRMSRDYWVTVEAESIEQARDTAANLPLEYWAGEWSSIEAERTED